MHNMWFTETSPLKLCIPATVLCSTILASKCRGDDGEPGQRGRDGDESIHIYRTEIPWKPIELDSEKNTFAIMAWTAVLSVGVTVAAIVCLCCLCWKLYPKYGSRRQSSNVALVPGTTSVTVMEFPATLEVHGRTMRDSRTGNRITNFASMGRPRDPTPSSQLEDGPPAYSTVISQTLTKDRPTSADPRVNETKTVETPPPAYITIAPFQ